MFKVLVPVKRVVDYAIRVAPRDDGRDAELAGVRMAMNPFDAIALEEAVRLREAGRVGEIVAVSIGPVEVEETLRQALALGADRALRIDTPTAPEPLQVARLLATLARSEQVDLLLLGKQAIDDDANQVAQMCAGLLDWPQACFASRISIDEPYCQVDREVDGGIETVTFALPAVISADLRLNTPRYVKLPALMAAKRKPIEQLSPAALGISVTTLTRRLSVAHPPARAAGVHVDSAEECLAALLGRGGLGSGNVAKALRPVPFVANARALVIALGAQPGEIPGLVAAAAQLAGYIDVIDDGSTSETAFAGATRRRVCTTPPADVIALAAWLAIEASDYDDVLAAADSNGKDWLPRAAALAGVQAFSDVIGFSAADILQRAIYAGDLIETVQSHQPRLWATVRTAAFASLAGEPPARDVLHAPSTDSVPGIRVLGRQAQGGLSLKDARALVAGGRALASADNFIAVLQPLAERLGGVLAASRAAVDAGYAPNSWQVGQTGQIVAPEVYVAVGISGAAQHVAGMRDSRLIIAINTDPDAPMMRLADIAWQADLFDAVPALCAALDGYCSRNTGL